jgi:hypothetical protein
MCVARSAMGITGCCLLLSGCVVVRCLACVGGTCAGFSAHAVRFLSIVSFYFYVNVVCTGLGDRCT